MARSAVILRISIEKHNVAAGTNSPSTTNEKRTIQAYRDFLKRKRLQPEHKAPKRYIEVGTSDLHRIQAAYIPVSRGSRYAPPQRITPGGRVRVQRIGKEGFANPAVPVLWCAARQ